MPEQSFIVVLRKQYPAWDERQGITYYIDAPSKAEAIKEARRRARDDGHTGTGTGRTTFTATVAA